MERPLSMTAVFLVLCYNLLMRKHVVVLVAVGIMVVTLIAVLVFAAIRMNTLSNTVANSATESVTTVAQQEISVTTKSELSEPIAEFQQRITKKPFGVYSTPETSPIENERFTGYHTGVDVEYDDVSTHIPVYAIADGEIVYSQTASGYGGVFLLQFELDGVTHNALYGHIRPSTLPVVGHQFKKGEEIAVLGTGFTSETDGERHHLHFAILANDSLDIRGYVQSENELSGWLDPVEFFNSH